MDEWKEKCNCWTNCTPGVEWFEVRSVFKLVNVLFLTVIMSRLLQHCPRGCRNAFSWRLYTSFNRENVPVQRHLYLCFVIIICLIVGGLYPNKLTIQYGSSPSTYSHPLSRPCTVVKKLKIWNPSNYARKLIYY